jgi:hypothetical protein
VTFRQKWLVRAFVLWTFFIMLVLVKNMLTGDDAWSFRFVHIGIAAISMTLAALVWPLARIPVAPDRDGDGEPG